MLQSVFFSTAVQEAFVRYSTKYSRMILSSTVVGNQTSHMERAISYVPLISTIVTYSNLKAAATTTTKTTAAAAAAITTTTTTTTTKTE